ncbi:magnesium-translocating P-type ATPase [Pseudonocardia humida]|uniref:Magnesium-transporting ATPase, P-type 1 n=1 Tax=Pseudonocardia humida TaxID=2800819 RepID=A0ABT0ZXG4_9PSEU|nr:magnesium-translocating P-type ATPase [Pseudonocardia humida]MCO1655442.1 magnesium-translocating P-type ATPase [Pseudonocardia humida]
MGDRHESTSAHAQAPPSPRPAVDAEDLAEAPPLVVLRRTLSSLKGLDEADAERRLARHGDNAPTPTRDPGLGAHLRTAVGSPFAGMLLVLGAILAVVGNAPGAVVVLVVAACSIALRLAEQLRSRRVLQTLRSHTTTTALVRRRIGDGPTRRREIPVADLVPGDVLQLAAGDLIPADVRLLTCADLLVDQSVLTGELLPVAKHAPGHDAPVPSRPVEPTGSGDPADLPTIGFAGTTVVRGTATAVVLATGDRTRLHAPARAGARTRSAAESAVRATTWDLLRFMVVLVPVVLLVNGTLTGDWATATTFAVAVAVGLAPELLPIIVTTTLARGARRLRAAGVLVSRLEAIHDLGGIDVLCMDKTGTLTEGRVVYTHAVDIGSRPDPGVARHAFLAAHFQTVPADPLDDALGGLLDDADTLLSDAVYDLVDELPFDHRRRRSTLVLHDALTRPDDPLLLVTKGDPDTLLPLCTEVLSEGRTVAFDDDLRRRARACLDEHRSQGMRVLAVARRRVDRHAARDGVAGLERELTLLGFVGFVDPVRDGAAAAVARAAELGVAVKVLTGDAPQVAARVCAAAGITLPSPRTAPGRTILGRDIDELDDDELGAVVEGAALFAALRPHHKARLVAALHGRGRSVGFVGDGVNDVDALRAADVGIGLADGAEAARAAADLVVLRGDLGVVATGIEEGRRTLTAATRYSTITAGLNLGNAASMTLAGTFLPFLPLLPVQLILQNLLYNAVALAIPHDRVDPAQLRRPHRWRHRGLLRFMLLLGALSTAFDLLTFLVVWTVLGMDTPAEQQVFQAVWFLEGILSQVLVLLVLRPRGARPSAALWGVAAVVAAVALALPATPFAAAVDMTAIPPAALAWLALIVAGYLVAVRALVPAYVRCTSPSTPPEPHGAVRGTTRE